jgi:hypothetical protein
LVDYAGRFCREGKAELSAEPAGIFDRLGSNAQSGRFRLEKIGQVDRWAGSSQPA